MACFAVTRSGSSKKKADQIFTLHGLLDFSPRKNEALKHTYLQGCYGAVPILDSLMGTPH
jgi:hypothetical protein